MQRSTTAILLKMALLAILITVTNSNLRAQQVTTTQRDTPIFTEAQKLGYLGQTSRDAMVRNILNRLKGRLNARDAEECPNDRVLCWHQILLDTISIDHTPDPDSDQVAFENGGPARTSRALAMTQIAVFDAVNSFDLTYIPYNDIGPAPAGASFDAAVAYASFGVQSVVYPAQLERLTALLESDVIGIEDTADNIAAGQAVGEAAAQAILDLRAGDGSDHSEPDWGQGGTVADGNLAASGFPINSGRTEAFEWEPDPLTPPISGDFRLALGAFWGAVTPFSLASGDQLRSPAPPTPGSDEYFDGYTIVQLLGASEDTLGSLSTPQTRFIGNYWGYDATPLLGAPPRFYNQIAAFVAGIQGVGTDTADMARYLAMVNVGLADSAIACWDSKYYYNYWRPVTGIRTTDGVLQTVEDPNWRPVGISVINTQFAITPTPPFPAYPSGHSTFGASTFEIMREFFGNETSFTMISEEYDGEGVDPLGVPRPLVPSRYVTIDQAQAENGLSRVYNGVHWLWDDVAGQDMGEGVAQSVFAGVPFSVASAVLLGDCNQDGTVDLLDIAIFVESVTTGEFQVEADCNEDGVVDVSDVHTFVAILTSV